MDTMRKIKEISFPQHYFHLISNMYKLLSSTIKWNTQYYYASNESKWTNSWQLQKVQASNHYNHSLTICSILSTKPLSGEDKILLWVPPGLKVNSVNIIKSKSWLSKNNLNKTCFLFIDEKQNYKAIGRR